ncbi:glycosyl transferase group 1 [Stanieria cyanosphaera PCC 7437]|uniref:Glycosyl transferase group 1 n=1 Tax=Stanieria cyanosphaera (strain ATCC 29371 / PCC 7437) TaxID=111780 RepID=K9XSK2_STAC7|nr:glycosyltransferase family 4 protein [Stanieria cyanosphaera]AFZ35051.1 glycosyl transferase group 1 [Stanieria cyanosphaera PCC 7437]
MLRLLFLSTPVGALGTGQGGGVELTVQNVAQELQQRGNRIEVVAPVGSKLQGISVTEIPGNLQVAVQTQSRDVPIILPDNSVLANIWGYARQVQSNYDLIVNFAFDWLPFYLTPWFDCPIAHFISMGSLTDALDRIMAQIAQQYPGTIGVYTKSQANTFSFADQCEILGSGIDLSLYQFCPQPENSLVWLGRIAPEKALEDAVAAAKITGIPLKIFGKIQDQDYWNRICQDFQDAPIEYGGFLSTQHLQQAMSKSRALLMTPRWVEAFGNVAIEALACGVPVIAYARGGPTEIIQDGMTGFLVEPDSVSGLVKAINSLAQINRFNCRQQAESEYSLTALGDRFRHWFTKILKS